MPKTHNVRQGDCISTIAYASGFFWETIWNHPENAQVKERRQNPNVLQQGDQVFIPDKRRKEEPCQTTRRHTFRIKGVPVKFNVRLLDSSGQPRSGLRYTLEIDGRSTTGLVPEDGLISKVIEPTAKVAKLKVQDPEEGEEVYEFRLGHLNPGADVAGLQARLKNLGLYDGDPNGTMDEATQEALSKYQERASLPVTGQTDEATQSALVEEHGS